MNNSVKKYILGIDEGTTSARAVLFDVQKNDIVKQARGAFKQYFPKNNWVEHDAEEIWEIVNHSLQEITDGITQEEIFALGITNQRESVVAFSKKTGKPLAPSICWQCRRTASFCNKLKTSSFAETIKEKTGLLPDAYFSASKIRWLLKNNKTVQKALEENDLLVGTIDAFLVYRLTKGKSFATDVTNASRTQLMNLKTLDWDDELLEIFEVPKQILPKIVSNCEHVGDARIGRISVPICSMIGDQQSSLFGQGCTNPGELKNTYGTGAFLLENTGDNIIYSKDLLTTVAYKIGKTTAYALEGSIYNCGTIVDWFCKTLGLAPSPKEMDALADTIKSSDGVYLVPAFTGLGCPYWDNDATGMFTGLTRSTTPAHLARACLESIAYCVYDVIKVFERESKTKINSIRVDGGVTNNKFLMQFQANLNNATIYLSNSESTSLGAIYLAGLASGAYSSINEIRKNVETNGVYQPAVNLTNTLDGISNWHKAVEKCLYNKKGE